MTFHAFVHSGALIGPKPVICKPGVPRSQFHRLSSHSPYHSIRMENHILSWETLWAVEKLDSLVSYSLFLLPPASWDDF
jgi:hypothetical protein